MSDKDTLNIRQVLGERVQPKSVVLIGLGNMDRADDALGLILASRIKACLPEQTFLETERAVEGIVMDKLEEDNITSFIFLDAVDFGGRPGEVQFFNIHDAQRFTPAFSTHKVPMVLLMGLIQQKGKNAYLLGVQPKNLEFMGEVSSLISNTIKTIEKALLIFLRD